MTDRLAVAIHRLRDLMATLRSPGGCPWDAEQTPESLKRYLVEETYEVIEALEAGSPAAIRDELGDLLLQIVFHARIYEERGDFDLADVATSIADKLVRRHPHVFAGAETGTAETLAAQWNRIKDEEKADRADTGHAAATIPRALPALQRAQKIAERVFRNDRAESARLIEAAAAEMTDLQELFFTGDTEAIESAVGDLFFTLVRIANVRQVDPEETLRKTNHRVLSAPAPGK